MQLLLPASAITVVIHVITSATQIKKHIANAD